MLATNVGYAVGFVARPLGGLVCGHFGDRVGRKSMLVLTLVLTGVATFLIGLLPTYESIGVAAPILLVLLRITQGFGVGGEWGGAVLLSVEHAPGKKRGYYGSITQMGGPSGMFLATAAFGLVSTLPPDTMFSWGWRVPYLLSLPLIVVAIYVRLSVEDSPAFAQVKESGTESKLPILDVVRRHPRNVLLAMGAKVAENGSFYLYTAFILIFAKSQYKLYTMSTMLYAVSLAAVVVILAMTFYGRVSDRVGRRRVYLFGAMFTALFAFPFFWLVETAQPALLTLAVVLAMVLGWAAMYAPQASFFSELFDTRVRYSGTSLGSQVATIFAGGLAPFIAESLLRSAGSTWPVALYLVGMAVVTMGSVLLASETAYKNIA
jgi:MFS family permease